MAPLPAEQRWKLFKAVINTATTLPCSDVEALENGQLGF